MFTRAAVVMCKISLSWEEELRERAVTGSM